MVAGDFGDDFCAGLLSTAELGANDLLVSTPRGDLGEFVTLGDKVVVVGVVEVVSFGLGDFVSVMVAGLLGDLVSTPTLGLLGDLLAASLGFIGDLGDKVFSLMKLVSMMIAPKSLLVEEETLVEPLPGDAIDLVPCCRQ